MAVEVVGCIGKPGNRYQGALYLAANSPGHHAGDVTRMPMGQILGQARGWYRWWRGWWPTGPA